MVNIYFQMKQNNNFFVIVTKIKKVIWVSLIAMIFQKKKCQLAQMLLNFFAT